MEMPPIEWLLDCSDTTLQDLELAALNRSSRHMKAAKADWNAAVDQAATAELARYLREHREKILELARKSLEGQTVIAFPERKRA
jgi:hypothetical protein